MGLLRLLLALSVVAAHIGVASGYHLVSSQIAVQSFFIISGFYMSLILNEKYIGKNNSYRLFITNRFFRLFPIYWTVLLFTVLMCLGQYLITKGHTFPKFDSYLSVKANVFSFGYLILTNLLLFGQDVVMFLGINPENGYLFFTSNFKNTHPPLFSFLFIPQAWTLGIELTFYLVAPFIVRKGFKIVVPLIILSFLLRLFIYDYLGLRNDPWTYRFFPTEIMFFLLGYVSFRIYLWLKTAPASNKISLFILFYILAFTILYPYLPSIKASYFPFSVEESFYFISVILSIPFLFNYLKRSKLDSQIGELSYPVYISHVLIVLVCDGLPFAFFKNGWTISAIVIIVSYLLNRVVAAPIEKYRQARLKK